MLSFRQQTTINGLYQTFMFVWLFLYTAKLMPNNTITYLSREGRFIYLLLL